MKKPDILLVVGADSLAGSGVIVPSYGWGALCASAQLNIRPALCWLKVLLTLFVTQVSRGPSSSQRSLFSKNICLNPACKKYGKQMNPYETRKFWLDLRCDFVLWFILSIYCFDILLWPLCFLKAQYKGEISLSEALLQCQTNNHGHRRKFRF
jgi:hypothetical protein